MMFVDGDCCLGSVQVKKFLFFMLFQSDTYVSSERTHWSSILILDHIEQQYLPIKNKKFHLHHVWQYDNYPTLPPWKHTRLEKLSGAWVSQCEQQAIWSHWTRHPNDQGEQG